MAKKMILAFSVLLIYIVFRILYKNRFMNFANQKMVEEETCIGKVIWENYWVDVAKANSERFNKLDANQHFKVMNKPD